MLLAIIYYTLFTTRRPRSGEPVRIFWMELIPD